MGYRYIGSKARIADEILEYIGRSDGKGIFIDAFAGTGVVSEKAADNGWSIRINDMMKNAVVMSEARLLCEEEVPFTSFGGYEKCINILNNTEEIEGFMWREYSPASKSEIGIERKYFTEKNARKIDAISEKLKCWYKDGKISSREQVLLLSDLISAVNDVANIAGTYGCFLSKWVGQSSNDLILRRSDLRKTKVNYLTSNLDVFDLECNIGDTVYLDPPYTKRQYASYYHILETLVCGDKPIVEGVSGLRPWKEKKSVFCYKTKALMALVELIKKQKAHRVVLSYSNEGHVVLTDLLKALSPFGEVNLVELSTIGRYTPNKTAVNNKTEVKEYLIDFYRKKG